MISPPTPCGLIYYIKFMETALQLARKDGGHTNVKHITQQYEVGLYIAIYTYNEKWLHIIGGPAQGSAQTKEAQYHKNLRAKVAKDTSGHVTFVEEQSTPL
jgi:hypothetical protein